MKSPKYSLKGFKMSKNLISAIKKALYVLTPAIVTEMVTNNIISAAIAGFVGPMILNAIEYWLKEY